MKIIKKRATDTQKLPKLDNVSESRGERFHLRTKAQLLKLAEVVTIQQGHRLMKRGLDRLREQRYLCYLRKIYMFYLLMKIFRILPKLKKWIRLSHLKGEKLYQGKFLL